MVVMLKQSCCGCSLGTGTIIIGIFETVGGIVGVILNIVAAVEAGPEPKAEESILEALDTIRVTSIIMAIIASLFALLGVLLIVGAGKSKPSYLVPWMASCCFFILIAVVSYVIKIVAYIEAGNTTLSAICVVGAILNVSIQMYFILVVYSLYRELTGEDLLFL